MKVQVISALVGLALRATAAPTPSSCGGVLSSVTIFDGESCSHMDHYWTKVTTTAELDDLKKANECVTIDPTWDAWSLRPDVVDEKCSFTVYQDKNCKVGGVTILEKMCITYNDDEKWQSYALRGCDRTE